MDARHWANSMKGWNRYELVMTEKGVASAVRLKG